MEFIVPGFIKLIGEQIRFYRSRPKIHVNVEADSTTGPRFVSRISLQDTYFNFGGFSTSSKSNVYVTIRNLGNQAVLIERLGVEIRQLSRSSFRVNNPITMRCAKLFPIGQAIVARRVMSRLTTTGRCVGKSEAKGPIRIKAYDAFRKSIGTFEHLEMIAELQNVKAPALVPYCVIEHQSHTIQCESIIIVADLTDEV